jgi:hypothetical protein
MRHTGNRIMANNTSLLTRLTWSLSFTISLGGFVIIALAVGVLPEGHWVRDLIVEIGVACVSAGIVSFVYENLIRRDLLDQVKTELADIIDTDARRLGITEIYESRTRKSDRVKLPTLIREARTEIMFVGLGLSTLVNEYRVYLEEALARGCTLRFLVFDLSSPHSKLLDASLGAGDLIENLKVSFGAVLSFAAKYADSGNVEVRLFDIVPTFGAVAIDRGEGHGSLFIELNCYASSGDQCPGFKLEKRPNGLFYNYDRQIMSLWTDAAGIPQDGDPASEELKA